MAKLSTEKKKIKIKMLKQSIQEAKALLRQNERSLAKFQKKHKHKMRAGGGAPKGHGFENAVAKMVAAAFTPFGIKREDCYRTPLSGGHPFAGKKDPGDLQMSPQLVELFPYCVECKFYKKIFLHGLLFPPKTWLKAWNFSKWLKQVCKAAKHTKRIPLLVIKGNNTPEFAILPRVMPLSPMFKRKIKFRWEQEDWIAVPFSDFLDKSVNQLLIDLHTRSKKK